MNELKVDAEIYIKGGEWEGMTGIIMAVQENSCLVQVKLFPPYEIIPFSDLEYTA